MALRYGGNLEAAYDERKTVFRPTLAQRAAATGLEATARVTRSLERQLGRLTDAPLPVARDIGVDCGPRWHNYCEWVATGVDYAVAHGMRVVVVTQPYCSDLHREQQQALGAMLARRYGQRSDVAHINLGQGIVDLKDPRICFDGAHLTAEGNARIAEALVAPVLSALDRSVRTVEHAVSAKPTS